jgi:hypothetical protein
MAGLAAAGALAFPALADEADHITLEYNGTLAGLPVLRAGFDASLEPDAYSGAVTFRSAGLAGFFKTARVQGAGHGGRRAAGFDPAAYTHVETTGRKTRTVELTYAEDDVDVDATPPFGSPGDPAPTAAQRREALDPFTAILEIMMGAGEAPCARTVPIFDSKLRYDLDFHPAGSDEDFRTPGYRGPARRCEVYYRPIAGYDPEDLADPEVYATPISFWLAEVAPGVWAPARINARFDVAFLSITVAVRLTKVETTFSDPT